MERDQATMVALAQLMSESRSEGTAANRRWRQSIGAIIAANRMGLAFLTRSGGTAHGILKEDAVSSPGSGGAGAGSGSAAGDDAFSVGSRGSRHSYRPMRTRDMPAIHENDEEG